LVRIFARGVQGLTFRADGSLTYDKPRSHEPFDLQLNVATYRLSRFADVAHSLWYNPIQVPLHNASGRAAVGRAVELVITQFCIFLPFFFGDA
jgi:hypothetical protein